MKALKEFINRYPVKKFDRGAMIIAQNVIPESVYIIKSGFVKAYDISAQGTEQLVWCGNKGDLFPSSWLFSVTDKTDFIYSALSKAELYCIDKDEMVAFLHDNNDALFHLTHRLASRYRDLLIRLN